MLAAARRSRSRSSSLLLLRVRTGACNCCRRLSCPVAALPYPRAAVAVSIARPAAAAAAVGVEGAGDRAGEPSDPSTAEYEYLLVQRKNAPGAGTWSLPGGKIRLGELVLDAGQREVHEETGIPPAALEWLSETAGYNDVIFPRAPGAAEAVEEQEHEKEAGEDHHAAAGGGGRRGIRRSGGRGGSGDSDVRRGGRDGGGSGEAVVEGIAAGAGAGSGGDRGMPELQFHYVLTQLVALAPGDVATRPGDDAAALRWETTARLASGVVDMVGFDVVEHLTRVDALLARRGQCRE